MNRFWQWVALFTLLAALCVPSGALAVPAFPGLIPIRDEATGETVSGYLRGDEFFSYRTDAEGRVIIADEAGCLRYVVWNGGCYALGGYLIAKNGDTAIGGTPVMEDDEGLEARLRALEKEIEVSRPIPLTGEGESAPFSPLEGHYDYNNANDALCGKMAQYSAYPTPEDYVERESTIPLLLIRVDYSDVKSCFTMLLSRSGFHKLLRCRKLLRHDQRGENPDEKNRFHGCGYHDALRAVRERLRRDQSVHLAYLHR